MSKTESMPVAISERDDEDMAAYTATNVLFTVFHYATTVHTHIARHTS